MMPMQRVKIAASLLFALLLLSVHLSNPHFFPELFSLLARGDIRETADYISSFGTRAIAFSFFLTVIVNIIGFPPAFIFSTANVLIFGIVFGIVLSCIAETVGVVISFLLLRHFFRDSAKKLISKSSALSNADRYSGKNGFTVTLIGRMVPYIPSAFLNAVGALSSVSLRDYALASLIGKFPSTSIEAIITHDAITREEDPTRIILAVIAALLLVLCAYFYERRTAKN